MKKNYFIIVLYLCYHPLIAQVNNDPLIGVYSKSGGSSELFVSYLDTSKSFSKSIIIKSDTTDYIQQNIGTNNNTNILKTAATSGDIDGDFKDDIITVKDTSISNGANIKNAILITAQLFNADLSVKKFVTLIDSTAPADFKRIRICSGNFDNDCKQEFAICYGPDKDDSLVIKVYKYDSDSKIRLLDSYKNIAYYDRNFDLCSGNLDEYFRNEIVLVKNAAPLSEVIGEFIYTHTTTTKYDLFILKFDPKTNKLVNSYIEKNITTGQTTMETSQSADYFFNELRVVCGDMNADNKDEITVGISFVQGFKSEDGWNEAFYFTFLHRFWFSDNGSLFQADCFQLNRNSYFWYKKYPVWTEYPLRSLSLKCEQFDNLDGDELIVSNYNGVQIYNEAGDKRNLNELYTLSNGYLNCYGNECFTVADLNSDTTQKYYNKEIITLETNVNHDILWPTSSDADNGGTFLVVYSFSDTNNVTLKETKKIVIDSNKCIKAAALNSGDFNFDEGEVLFLGTPEMIKTEIQQPVVILNSPPIHYDIIDGIPNDLNNAYNSSGNPPFYATYYQEKGEKKTTTVSTQTSYAFSNEWKDYNMKAGNGFENTTLLATETNNDYYQGYEQQISLGNKLDVYKEDWILCSNLEYMYYRYPIYNSNLKKLGYYGILSPHSQLVYSWNSGNASKQLGYIFDHEPGNILSYKSVVNSGDFSEDTSGFISKAFANQITISNSSNGDFSFTYSDICNEGKSYSYQSLLGQNNLTKSGYEATVGAEMGFSIKDVFSFSVSNDVNLNIGSSFDIEQNFSNTGLFTQKTELSESFNISGVMGNLVAFYDNTARYKVTPYIYRSQCGAIVLDYKVTLDPERKSWWSENYGKKSDLAFILPLRYGTEHGVYSLPSQKQKTNEIQFYPPVVSPGDTVCLISRVHNYSLKPFINNLKVEYYLGNPQTTGVKITDIFGNSQSKKLVHLDYNSIEDSTDFEETLLFTWKVPDTVTCSPRIYAVIDPDSSFDEIHENNNIGWNKLYIYGCEECNYPELVTGFEEELVTQGECNVSVYPNPFSSSTSIQFTLSVPERVRIELYSLSGVNLGIIKDQYYTAGQHTIQYNGSELTGGIYLLKTTVGQTNSRIKISIMH
jgi:hypothetical protein